MRLNEVLTPKIRKDRTSQIAKHVNDGEKCVDHRAVSAVHSRMVTRMAMPRIKTMLRKHDEKESGTVASKFI